MDLGIITDKPQHPMVAALAAQLVSHQHRVRLVDPGDGLAVQREARRPAEAYLLRSHDAASIELARRVERAGAVVVNGPAASAAVQDRLRMSTTLVAEGLPWPESFGLDRLGRLLPDVERRASLAYPLVVKSRWSRRSELVALVRSVAELTALAAERPDEEVIVQRAVPNDGQDRKLYVIDGRVFALRRPSPLSSGDPEARTPMAVPAEWARLARAAGKAFGLGVCGVDVLVSGTGPVICDVNSFPGFRGIAGAPEALVAMVDGLPLSTAAAAA